MKEPENRKKTANPAVAATIEGSIAFQVMIPFSRVVSMKMRAPANGEVRNAPKKPLMAERAERVTTGGGMRAFSAMVPPAAPVETVSGASGPSGAPQTRETSPRKKSSNASFQGKPPFLTKLDEILCHDGNVPLKIMPYHPGTQPPGKTDNQDAGIKNRRQGVNRYVFPEDSRQNVLEENKRDHHEGADNPDEGDKEQEKVKLSGVQRVGSFIDLFTAGIFGHCRSPV